MKNLIYWIGFVLAILGGIIISASQLLSVKNTSIFLLGFMWCWNGITLIFDITPLFPKKYAGKYKFFYSIILICLGLTWTIIALTPLADQAIPMIIVSAPFLIFVGILSVFYRKNK